MKFKIAPSILAADFWNLGREIQLIEEAGADLLHIDVMDGTFVPNISLGIPVITSIRNKTKLLFDVHLMIEEPIRYIEKFVKAGADSITVHEEACSNLEATLQKIKSYGVKCGISINPETSLSSIKEFIPKVDMILLMSVHPGFGGQKYMEEVSGKIIEARKYIDMNNLECDIEVDGGITLENVEKITDIGANVIVSGSSIFCKDVSKQVALFKSKFPK